MIIQIKPCIQLESGITWAEDREPEFFGVYYGEPGNFKWLADFKRKVHAEFFAFMLAQNDGVSVEN